MKKKPVKSVVKYTSKRGSVYELRNIDGELVCFVGGKKRPITREISDQFYAERPEGSSFAVYIASHCTFSPGGLGGFGCIITDKEGMPVTELSGGYESSTINRVLLMGMIKAMGFLPSKAEVEVITDSDYAPNIMNGVYRKKSNLDLWAGFETVSKDKKITCKEAKTGNEKDAIKKCMSLVEVAMYSEELHKDPGYANRQRPVKKVFSGDTFGFGPMEVPINIVGDTDKSPEMTSAEEYAEKFEVNLECAESLKAFWSGKFKSYKSFASLKTGGSDRFSAMDAESLYAECGDVAKGKVKEFLSGNDVLSALRWHCRGLSITDSIRKVLVNKDIAEKLNRK